jgi:NADH-quinone oxidoreductase subunit L
MRNMGGLWKKMPMTAWTFMIATVAIAGIPPLAGFFSKDEILWQAFSNPLHGNLNYLLWGFGAVAALLTAFYMFRLVFMTFFGECRINPKAKDHLHESPMVVVFPLIVLAFLSFVGGWIGIPKVIGDVLGGVPNKFEHFLAPVFEFSEEFVKTHAHAAAHHSAALEWGLMGLSVVIAVIGIGIAFVMYVANNTLPARFTATFPALHRAVFNKWYVDELYDFLFVNPCKALGNFLWKGFDVVVIDGIVDGTATMVMGISGVLKNLQSGYVHNYALSMALGVVVIIAFYIFN